MATDNRRLPTNPNHSNVNILIHPDIDALYRQMTPSCKHCGLDTYTRFRYFNNKNAVLRRCQTATEEGADIWNILLKLQARFACRSPQCLANNPGKSEVEFTHDGKTRQQYKKKRPRMTAGTANQTSTTGRSKKRLKSSLSPQQQQHEGLHQQDPTCNTYADADPADMMAAYPYHDDSMATYNNNNNSEPSMSLPSLVDVDNHAYPVVDQTEATLYYAFNQEVVTTNYAMYPIDQAAAVNYAACTAIYATYPSDQEDPAILHQQRQQQQQQQQQQQHLDVVLGDDREEDVLQSLGIWCDEQWVGEEEDLLQQQKPIYEDLLTLLQH